MSLSFSFHYSFLLSAENTAWCLDLFMFACIRAIGWSLEDVVWSGSDVLHCKHTPCVLLLWGTGTRHSHTFLPLLTSPFFFFLISSSLPSAFSPCPVPELSVWTDCDIGCVGDRPAGVISEGRENRSASLYLTPSLLHRPLMKEGLTGDSGECYSFIFQKVDIFLGAPFEFKVS